MYLNVFHITHCSFESQQKNNTMHKTNSEKKNPSQLTETYDMKSLAQLKHVHHDTPMMRHGTLMHLKIMLLIQPSIWSGVWLRCYVIYQFFMYLCTPHFCIYLHRIASLIPLFIMFYCIILWKCVRFMNPFQPRPYLSAIWGSMSRCNTRFHSTHT